MTTSTRDRNTNRDAPTTPNATSWRVELTVATLGVIAGLAAVLLFLS